MSCESAFWGNAMAGAGSWAGRGISLLEGELELRADGMISDESRIPDVIIHLILSQIPSRSTRLSPAHDRLMSEMSNIPWIFRGSLQVINTTLIQSTAVIAVEVHIIHPLTFCIQIFISYNRNSRHFHKMRAGLKDQAPRSSTIAKAHPTRIYLLRQYETTSKKDLDGRRHSRQERRVFPPLICSKLCHKISSPFSLRSFTKTTPCWTKTAPR